MIFQRSWNTWESEINEFFWFHIVMLLMMLLKYIIKYLILCQYNKIVNNFGSFIKILNPSKFLRHGAKMVYW